MKFINKVLNGLKNKLGTLFVFDYDFDTNNISFKKYMELVQSGTLKDQIFFGINADGFIKKNPLSDPGGLTIGTQGSGKSTLMKTMAITSQIASGESTFQILNDYSDKGMNDYSALKRNKWNSVSSLFEIEKIIPMMDLLYKEVKARGKAFTAMDNSKDAEEYNKAYRKKLASYKEIHKKIKNGNSLSKNEIETLENIHSNYLLRLPRRFEENLADFRKREKLFLESLLNVINSIKSNTKVSSEDLEYCDYTDEFPGVVFLQSIFEEFHTIPCSPEVDFEENKRTPGTVAYKMFQIARTGRSFLIDIFGATQKAGHIEFPSDLKIGISPTNIFAHKVSDEYASSAVDLPKATEITINGRSISKEGFNQCPFLSPEVMDYLAENYAKPCTGILFTAQIEDYHNALSGKGAEGMILNYPFYEIVVNFAILSKSLGLIVKRLLNAYDFKYTELEEGKYPTEVNGIAEKDGVKYAVIYGDFSRRYRGEGVSQKKIMSYKCDMPLLDVTSFICIAFGEESGLKALAKQTNGYYFDIEDLKNTALIMDNKEQLIASGNYERKSILCPFTANQNNSNGSSNEEITFDDSDDF